MRGRSLPTGTVTFLFTDVEGSTRLLQKLGPEGFAAALDDHQARVRRAVARHGGVEVDTEGDAFFVAFSDPAEAVAAAAEAQADLAQGPIRVRMGLHTGTPLVTGGKYIGEDVHLAARIAAAGHGGQVVLSPTVRAHSRLEVSDLGEHRLKDFDEPVWLYQLGGERFPPLKTISNSNLPRPPSRFVGREREVAAVTALLHDGARLVTLTGPGGTGKTRLLIEAATELVPEERNGVFWVELAALREPALVMEAVAMTLGAKEGVAGHIGEREMLLVLDNFEQVVDAAPELPRLLERCPNLRILVSSRERLRVRGEVEFSVPPLAGEDAVRLFCECSGLEPEPVLDELCRRLDRLPLAVELAAARASVLAPGQILARIGSRLDLLEGGRDAEPRQHTLRATVAWSFDLLDEAERRLCRGLAIFAGGCTLESAEAVLDADLDVLQSLVDKSLLRRTGERFWMLEVIREFALEQLEQSGEAAAVADRHAGHFVELAEQAFPQLKGAPKDWLDRLDAEHDNLRAALDRLERSGAGAAALQLAGALYRFWYIRGYLQEGRRHLERLLAQVDAPPATRARALQGEAVLTLNTGDVPAARRAAEEALPLFEALGDGWGVAYSKYLLGMAATEEEKWAEARALFEQCVELFRQVPDAHYTLLALDGVAWTVRELGDLPRSRALHEEILRQARAEGNQRVQIVQLVQLASWARRDGRAAEALALYRECFSLCRELGDPAGAVQALCGLAEIVLDTGDREEAARLLAAAGRIVDEIGGTFRWVLDQIDSTRSRLVSELGREAFAAAWQEGAKLEPGEVDELVDAI